MTFQMLKLFQDKTSLKSAHAVKVSLRERIAVTKTQATAAQSSFTYLGSLGRAKA
jgi:hypothetical protein